MSEKKQLTEGQKRVRLDFNPAGLKRVVKVKTLIADTIDYLENAKNAILEDAPKIKAERDDIGFVVREISTAQTSLQQASTMAVGALTTDLSFATLGNAKVTDEDLEIKTGDYIKKPVSISIITFDDFIAFGKSVTGNKNLEGYPLSFSYKDHPITHESNTCYIIPTKEGFMKFTPNDVLITGVQGEIYPCKIDIFKQTYTQ